MSGCFPRDNSPPLLHQSHSYAYTSYHHHRAFGFIYSNARSPPGPGFLFPFPNVRLFPGVVTHDFYNSWTFIIRHKHISFVLHIKARVGGELPDRQRDGCLDTSYSTLLAQTGKDFILVPVHLQPPSAEPMPHKSLLEGRGSDKSMSIAMYSPI